MAPRQAMRVKLPGHFDTVLMTVTAPVEQSAAGILTDLLLHGTAIGHEHNAALELSPGSARTHRSPQQVKCLGSHVGPIAPFRKNGRSPRGGYLFVIF